jgi:winged helix-turn-helix protein DUF2582
MDMNGEVSQMAGQVWHVLSSDGPHTLVQLKKKLNATIELVNFGVGWLAREDKLEIIPDKKSFRVQLK